MKKRVKYLVVFMFIFVIIGLALFWKTNNYKTDDLKVVLGSEPNSLDPAISLTMDVRSYLSSLYEGLVNINEKGEVSPGIAKKWVANKENTEFTFYLRKNAQWSDGSKITAEDFKYSWLRVLNPDAASGWASYLYYIDGAEEYNIGETTADNVGITIEDEYTLKVKLANPCNFFVSMTSLQPYYPVKKSAVGKDGIISENFVSNGAFVLKSWNHNEKISVEKNDKYWNKENIKIDRIEFELFSDSNAIMNAYEAGNIDYVANMLTNDEMLQLDTIKTSNFTYTKFLAFNTKKDVLKNKNIRKAISLALDREEIANLMGEGILPLTGFIPKGFYNTAEDKDYTKDSNSTKYISEDSNIKEAKKLINKSGFTNIKLTYLTNNSSTNIALAEIIKNQLDKVGIELDIQVLEKKVFNEYRKNKKFDIVAASWAAEYPDISSYLYGFKSNDLNNYSSFSNNEYDELYNSIILEDNVKKKFKLVHDAEDLIMNSYAVAPLYFEDAYYISNDNVKGDYYDITGCLVLKYAYEM